MSTPSAPDVDQPDGGAHEGDAAPGTDTDTAGRTRSNPDNDMPDGGDDAS